jgi:hypothetical protein
LSTIPLVSISPEDPSLTTTTTTTTTWQPPQSWAELDLPRDQQSAAEALADLGLWTKATNLCTCGKYFIPILQYSNHWARLGKATCHHKFACRGCGTGKSRVHRLFTVAPERFAFIISDVTRTMSLSIRHDSPCATLLEYRARIKADKLFMRRMRQKHLCGRDVGYIMAVEPDPRMCDVTFRVYYVGPILENKDIRQCWQSIVGMRGHATSKVMWDDPREALRWTLDASCHILMLPGAERAAWEAAFQGYRMTSSCGALRGIDLDEPATEEGTPRDPAAPYGYCPCGCGGVVTKADRHSAASLTTLASRFRQLSFGPLKDYAPYSPKVSEHYRGGMAFPHPITTCDHSPPS